MSSLSVSTLSWLECESARESDGARRCSRLWERLQARGRNPAIAQKPKRLRACRPRLLWRNELRLMCQLPRPNASVYTDGKARLRSMGGPVYSPCLFTPAAQRCHRHRGKGEVEINGWSVVHGVCGQPAWSPEFAPAPSALCGWGERSAASPKPFGAVQTPSTLCGLVNQIFALYGSQGVGCQGCGAHAEIIDAVVRFSDNPTRFLCDASRPIASR